ncbi:MAG: methyltransferase domain-containing protein [Phycisphaerales bacterium]|nr:MAG: methyltransferase domain-containing protein [Phycisphaerales bacterium]
MGMKRIDKIVKKNGFLCLCVRELVHLYYARMFGVSADEFDQIETTTAYNRYPELFDSVRTLISPRDTAEIRILSYGCSTGQECWTLRDYFPNAHIIGLDINERSLRTARAENTDAKIEFFRSTPENLVDHGPYDLIFALSVLCRWPETQFVNDASRLYPFEKFDETIALFDVSLSRGGLMVILNANYHFSDTQVSGRYEPLVGIGLSQHECVHKFSTNNQKLREGAPIEWIFKKIATEHTV